MDSDSLKGINLCFPPQKKSVFSQKKQSLSKKERKNGTKEKKEILTLLKFHR